MKLGRPWTGMEIAAAIGGKPYNQAESLTITHISWDSRRLVAGQPTIFIALRAQRDGHDFIPDAARRGATLFLVEKPLTLSLPHILVSDTWEALYKWASAWRAQLPYPLIGITGSVGKTWVKEWLAYLLEGEKEVHRSPGSYNSRLGVPLSLLSFPPSGDLGIIEAGISAPGEMAPLARLIRPTYGILTLMGSAHDEAFPDFQTKLQEKLKLFSSAEWLLALSQPETRTFLREAIDTLYTVGTSPEDTFWWERTARGRGQWHVPDRAAFSVELPGDSPAVWQNALIAASAAYLLSLPPEKIQEKLPTFPTLAQRLQWLQDGSGRLWLNDTYHADATSVAVAIEELRSLSLTPKAAILTDFSPYDRASHEAAMQALRSFLPDEAIHVIGEVFSEVPGGQKYASVEAFLREARLPTRGAILLKGSRRFHLEEAFQRLTGYGPAPELHINWEKVYRNLTRLRARLPTSTRLMGVLKAEAYGSGDLLMASFLERQGIHYIGVAYAREAIRLREAGIRVPILVFYPGKTPPRLFLEYHLEAAVGTPEMLHFWAGSVPIHVEVDTGMGRMGLSVDSIPPLLKELHTIRAEVRGVFTHLAAAESPEHPLTQQQLRRFAEAYTAVKAYYPDALGHVLNTAGILTLGEAAAYDMVRIGIGLYGIGEGLEEATQLKAPILRVTTFPAGMRLNYGFFSTVPPNAEIATLALGYGDGLSRSWGENGGKVFLYGHPCPILPPINMDLTLIAVPRGLATEGDKVEIWGRQRSLAQLAAEANTIPYELLVRLSQRVYRFHSWGESE